MECKATVNKIDNYEFNKKYSNNYKTYSIPIYGTASDYGMEVYYFLSNLMSRSYYDFIHDFIYYSVLIHDMMNYPLIIKFTDEYVRIFYRVDEFDHESIKNIIEFLVSRKELYELQ